MPNALTVAVGSKLPATRCGESLRTVRIEACPTESDRTESGKRAATLSERDYLLREYLQPCGREPCRNIPRVYLPEETAWIRKRPGQLIPMGVAHSKIMADYSSAVVEVPEGVSYRFLTQVSTRISNFLENKTCPSTRTSAFFSDCDARKEKND